GLRGAVAAASRYRRRARGPPTPAMRPPAAQAMPPRRCAECALAVARAVLPIGGESATVARWHDEPVVTDTGRTLACAHQYPQTGQSQAVAPAVPACVPEAMAGSGDRAWSKPEP